MSDQLSSPSCSIIVHCRVYLPLIFLFDYHSSFLIIYRQYIQSYFIMSNKLSSQLCLINIIMSYLYSYFLIIHLYHIPWSFIMSDQISSPHVRSSSLSCVTVIIHHFRSFIFIIFADHSTCPISFHHHHVRSSSLSCLFVIIHNIRPFIMFYICVCVCLRARVRTYIHTFVHST